MPITIYDIAQKCNCSTATVSKVFNKTGKISKETRAKILEAAKELNYVPNVSASSLASENHSSKLIAVLLYIQDDKSFTHELFSSVLNAFRIEMEKYGYDICFIGKLEKNSHISYLSKIKSRGCDGVFALCVDREDKLIQELTKADIPLIAFDSDQFAHRISSNNEDAVAELVDYLVEMGHKEIAFINPASYGVSKERANGFIKGLERNNIPFDPKYLINGSYYNKNAAKIDTDNALNNGFKPSVIMYPDDYTAICAVTYLKSLGYDVPKDIGVTGFDGIEINSLLKNPLATVAQNTEEIGRQAAINLYSQIMGKKCSDHVVVKASILRGASIKKEN